MITVVGESTSDDHAPESQPDISGIMLVIGVSFPMFLASIPPLAYFYYLVMLYVLADLFVPKADAL
jgi:hypothetical protein